MPAAAFNVRPLKAFHDNYIWSLEWPNGACVVVDPGDATPVLAHLAANGLRLTGILITHHHADHIGGIERLLREWPVPVYGPAAGHTVAVDHGVGDGDQVLLNDVEFHVLEIPGHTLDHIAFYTPGTPPRLFCGDTLFAGGCGRVFEGTPAMMYQSLQKLAALPAATEIFCAHEYTLANLRFAQAIEGTNQALQERLVQTQALRDQDRPTLPSTLDRELATNPFLRCTSPEVVKAAMELDAEAHSEVTVFAALRELKNRF